MQDDYISPTFKRMIKGITGQNELNFELSISEEIGIRFVKEKNS